ncbi:MAG: hypothetical protein K0Q90_1491, partial [Paenibacillaceae bacterium]|nr:hypothetical protein [Paenibacillaceae bacterium]
IPGSRRFSTSKGLTVPLWPPLRLTASFRPPPPPTAKKPAFWGAGAADLDPERKQGQCGQTRQRQSIMAETGIRPEPGAKPWPGAYPRSGTPRTRSGTGTPRAGSAESPAARTKTRISHGSDSPADAGIRRPHILLIGHRGGNVYMLIVHLFDNAVKNYPVVHVQTDKLVHMLLAQAISLLLLHAAFLPRLPALMEQLPYSAPAVHRA